VAMTPLPEGGSSLKRWLPLMVACASSTFTLWFLRGEATPGKYLNDSAIHASMVRWAAARLTSGHLPFDGWYPYLSLGASRFHHYQSLPHILTGAATAVLGARTFAWSGYLLLGSWPLAVYAGGRLLELDPWSAAAAAVVAPLLVSASGLGYEYSSYTWTGSGAWSQLWGMWALPLALGLSWRAVARGGSLALGALAVGVTVCLHLLTGYLALLAVGLWVVVAPSELRRRVPRAATVLWGAMAVAAWVLVPLIWDRGWTIQDEFSRGTFYYDSFGAYRVLGWLFTGSIFDHGRLPVVSVLVALGVAVTIALWRREEAVRAVAALGLISLVLFFGRPTLGPALRLLPASGDLFLRRYISGVHLAGIYLAGVGTVAVGRRLAGMLRGRLSPARPWVATGAAVAAACLMLLPAWIERAGYARVDGTFIARQRAVDAGAGEAFAQLVRMSKADGPGRVFAGLRSLTSSVFSIGEVPAYAYLLDLDADAVGFTRPTWSLVSNVEARFDPSSAEQYALFGIRAAIQPAGRAGPPGATLQARRGPFALWRLPTDGYVSTGDTIAPIAVDRTDLGQQMASFLDSRLPADSMYPTLSFGGRPAAAPTLPANALPSGPPGRVLDQVAGPADGVFAADVELIRAGVVVFKSSFDPRWEASIDGRDLSPEMVAPGFLAVDVPPGKHTVVLSYRAFPAYALLFALALVALVALMAVDNVATARQPL
jgi:hypothetical protein